jgi:uncharacterized membrane protein YwaF
MFMLTHILMSREMVPLGVRFVSTQIGKGSMHCSVLLVVSLMWKTSLFTLSNIKCSEESDEEC